MNSDKLRRAVVIATASVVVLLLVSWLWSYALSFQSVTFEYDDSLGYIELTSDVTEPLYPPAGEEVRLKKATYHMQTIGDNIESSSEDITIDSTSDTLGIEFTYNRTYLDSLYADEKDAILALISTTYPQIESRYTITRAALYGKGEIFGAQLVATTPSDHSDTLRILLQKQSDEWRVLSNPPTPILSAPEYPQIDPQILRTINQAR